MGLEPTVCLLAGGGPSTPDGRVLRAMTTPLIGQFDPDFTAIMDDVMALGRRAFRTRNQRCFPVSGLGPAAVEAVLNTLVEDGDRVAISGAQGFVSETAEIARRCGAEVVDDLDANGGPVKLVVASLVDTDLGKIVNVEALASAAHARGARLIVDASFGLGACELKVDDWGLDACVAAVEYGVGAPAGMALVTYSSELERMMGARADPPRTSYLDLLQLQAYWSSERLNHHTAPTTLVYGLREALRLVDEEGLGERWARHARVAAQLRDGLRALGLQVTGDSIWSVVSLTSGADEAALGRRLRDEYGVWVASAGSARWRVGLVGADARTENVNRVLAAIEKVACA